MCIRDRLYGVSLCMGGFLDITTGVLQYSALTPEWGYNVPLKEMLQERFPEKEIAIDNVARMAACAEVLDLSLIHICKSISFAGCTNDSCLY